jgi:hypothetical protein
MLGTYLYASHDIVNVPSRSSMIETKREAEHLCSMPFFIAKVRTVLGHYWLKELVPLKVEKLLEFMFNSF